MFVCRSSVKDTAVVIGPLHSKFIVIMLSRWQLVFVCRSSVKDMATVIGPPVDSYWCLCRSSVEDMATVIGSLHSRVHC